MSGMWSRFNQWGSQPQPFPAAAGMWLPDGMASPPFHPSISNFKESSGPGPYMAPLFGRQKEHSLYNRRTLFIDSIPPTVDNNKTLWPYVPTEGLTDLRVRRCGSRNVGFAEYQNKEYASLALQWFHELDVTADIAFRCLSLLPMARMQQPPECLYPVPYEEYNRCARDPVRSTNLLMSSVILSVEWSVSTSPHGQAPAVAAWPSPSLLHPHNRSRADRCVGSVPLTNTAPSPFAQHATDVTPRRQMRLLGQSSSKCHTGPIAETWTCSAEVCAPAEMHSSFAHLSRGISAMHPAREGKSNSGLGLDFGEVLPDSHRQHVCTQTSRKQSERDSPVTSAFPPPPPPQPPQKNLQTGVDSLCATIVHRVPCDGPAPVSTLFVRIVDPQRPNSPATPSYSSHRRSSTPPAFHSSSSLALSPVADRPECSLPLLGSPRDRAQEPSDLYRRWSQFHHRHHSCAEQWVQPSVVRVEEEAEKTITSLEVTHREALSAATAPLSPSLSTISSKVPDDEAADALLHKVLSHDFYCQRFAGFCSYVAYSGSGGFVRFEQPRDAQRCLRWLKQQVALKGRLDVQFARKDTRQSGYTKH
ncbi:hypothetical protein ERJ75_000822600 [Trypanosoma vivax]|uniref:Uncharacterized protein n=1 Tax=Trypanosoma vivax (strain Y486) TaxID=1055687 RepID=G0UBI2_TRYVY|nr:hypothetical protein TRVL_03679 [Trypanosoma vivax]KAH8613107.1 hypothetical protein ERJ75_000822600 [Trypanosoma vivax]CCC53178.1 conserved hypothetical protein [Trypanosoma vivax Y486]